VTRGLVNIPACKIIQLHLERIVTSTGVEILTGVGVDSTFDEADAERLELVHQVVDGSGVIAQRQHDQRSLDEQTSLH